ncbi:hypothetical protein N657DRAFT_667027 [Parathielavia appendiculata]|uniref:Uncharacterized protein n=1 Tax=Parathielavia appendiculata TaxID=2587402 RepID=A0AAN6TQG3_9PEZI|nr:hypothetical protein N657DRAFT_667027 [Parathielavia appendiculata]
MSTQSSTNIEPLHRQRIKGREILVTEDPRLHLVWIHDRIFIKPIPRYLLSHRSWEDFLLPKPPVRGTRQENAQRAAAGYLRSYCYLIQHESDFDIAKQDHLRLVPRHVELSRLNFYAPFLFGKFNFQKPHGQYSDYFARFYGPLLFAFAVASTVLSSLQVEMASVCRWTSTLILVATVLIALGVWLLWLWLFCDECLYALKRRARKRREILSHSDC